MSYALLPLLRTGRTDQAREVHLAGYRACRRNPSMSGEVGRHLEFCALTGNEARGLELLAENRNLFDEVDSPLDLLSFLTGAEVLLQRVELLGHGELPAAGYAGRPGRWPACAPRCTVAPPTWPRASTPATGPRPTPTGARRASTVPPSWTRWN